MTTSFAGLLSALSRHRGVTACMVVDERDGTIVDANLHVGVDGAAAAALIGALYRKAHQAAAAAGYGETSFFQFDAERGRACVAGRNGLLLVMVAESRMNVGLARVEMLRALDAFA